MLPEGEVSINKESLSCSLILAVNSFSKSFLDTLKIKESTSNLGLYQ